MEKLEFSFRKKWGVLVEHFARMFGLKMETANTTLLVAIVPAMIAVSRGISYIGQCIIYGAIFRIPISMLKFNESLWISLATVIFSFIALYFGFFFSKLYFSFFGKIDTFLFNSNKARKNSKAKTIILNLLFTPIELLFFLCGASLPLWAMIYLDRVFKAEMYNLPINYGLIVSIFFLFWIGIIINLMYRNVSNKNSALKTNYHKIPFICIVSVFVCIGLQCIFIGSVEYAAYPVTYNETGQVYAIIYMTNEVTIMEKAEIDENTNTLTIDTRNQEIPSQTTSLNYEYKQFNHVTLINSPSWNLFGVD